MREWHDWAREPGLPGTPEEAAASADEAEVVLARARRRRPAEWERAELRRALAIRDTAEESAAASRRQALSAWRDRLELAQVRCTDVIPGSPSGGQLTNEGGDGCEEAAGESSAAEPAGKEPVRDHPGADLVGRVREDADLLPADHVDPGPRPGWAGREAEAEQGAARLLEAVETGRLSISTGYPAVDALLDGRGMSNALDDPARLARAERDAGQGWNQTRAYYEMRARAEANAFGIPAGDQAGTRPVYAAVASPLAPLDRKEMDRSFGGEVRIELRDSVKSRATFSGGDSVQDGVVPVTREGLRSGVFDPTRTMTSPDVAESRYVEAQVFGGVHPEDVERVVFLKEGPRSEALIAALKERGIEADSFARMERRRLAEERQAAVNERYR